MKESALPGGSIARAVTELRLLALRGLRRMYRPESGRFAFTLRRSNGGDVLEGASRRYTAIALIGLSKVQGERTEGVCGNDDLREVGERLATEVDRVQNLGDIALTLWASVELKVRQARQVRDRLLALRPWEGAFPTVELAWALTALSKDSEGCDSDATRRTADRLLDVFYDSSGMFAHGSTGRIASRLRAHVTCFADLIYPIQALAHYYQRTGRARDLEVARRCAERICGLQGPSGQWWWHYDVRTGRVLERYPVYSVHQHAMAPMALRALRTSSGDSNDFAALRGLRWLLEPAELDGSLMDREAGVVWRKVARREPGKLSRTLQALTSRVHPRLRMPGLEQIFRPGAVDYECRPYELGWLLYAWSEDGSES